MDQQAYLSRGCRLGYCSSKFTSSSFAPITATHPVASDAISSAWISVRADCSGSNDRGFLIFRFESTDELSLAARRCLFRVSRLIHPSSSSSLSLSNSTRSLAGDLRDDDAVPALRFRSVRCSSEDDSKGLLLFRRLAGDLTGSPRPAFAREDALANGFGAFGGGLGSLTTFSTRIFGVALLNLLLRPSSGMTCCIGEDRQRQPPSSSFSNGRAWKQVAANRGVLRKSGVARDLDLSSAASQLSK